MRGFIKIGVVAALVGEMLVAVSDVSSGQNLNEADALNKKGMELYRAGKYEEAIPLAQRVLAIREKALGPDHLKVAASLNNLAEVYREQRRYTDAEPLIKRALAIREKALAPGHPDIANSLNNLAETYKSQGRYADAEPLFKRLVAIDEKTLGPDHPKFAASLFNLAQLYHEQSRYADAEPLFKRSLAIEEKALGPEHPGVAITLNDLGRLYRAQGRYADAVPLLNRAIAIYEKTLSSDHPFVGTALNNLASLYAEQGRYADAEPLYKRSLAITEKALGPNHSDVAGSLNNLALLYVDEGRYDDAEPLYKRSLAISETALGPAHPDVAHSLNSLAELYRLLGRYADAEPLFKRSLAIEEKALGPDHRDVATSLNNQALNYHEQGRYADAELLYKRSLAIREKVLGPNHPDVANSLNNLAELYTEYGRYADVEPLYKRSLALRETVLGPDHPDVAGSLSNLAGLYTRQGRYADAEPLYERSLAVREKVLGPSHHDVASSLSNLALLYKYQGRYSESEQLYKRSLAIDEKALGYDNRAVGTTLNNLAELYKSQARYADAEPLLNRSLAIYEKVLGPDHLSIGTAMNNLAGLYKSQGRFGDALPLVRMTAQKGLFDPQNTLPVLSGALTNSLITKTVALNESYNVVQQTISSAASNAISQLSIRFAAGTSELAQFVRKDQDLSAEAERLDKLIIAAVSKPPNQRHAAAETQIRNRIEEITSEREKLQNIFNQRFPDYLALSKPQPLSVEQTQALLADNEALVAFDFDARSYVWVITKTNTDWVELKVSANDLNEQVKQLRQSLRFDADKPFDVSLAHKIYEETIGSIADKLAGKKPLSVVTNGALTSLPLQLLITQDPSGKSLKDTDWLIRSYAITVLPSVYSLKTLRSQSVTSSAHNPMIAFADPIFSKRGTKPVAALRSVVNFYEGGKPDLVSLARVLLELPETEAEVRAIAEVLNVNKNDLKFGADASETTVKNAKLDDYRIIYFATHALVAGEVEKFAKVKAEPALALTIPDKPTELDDGLLTASEVAQLKLNADWVVLSACNTAAEDKPGAEALSGLARAFFYAGARSLVVSHWEVDSIATVQLMIDMFQAAARDPRLSHAEALQQSTLRLIESAKSDHDAHPRFWAPFVVVGEPAKQQ
jgi:CHAT domain-containing protein/Tfp pilus assembly protein PilF